MTLTKTGISTALAALMISNPAFSAESNITGSGEAGYTQTNGNTESTTSLFAALKMAYDAESWKTKGLLEATDEKVGKIKTKERYVADVQLDRAFANTPQAFAFVQARYENDDIAQIELNSTYVLGLGYEFFNTDKKVLSAEAGAGYQDNNYTSEGEKDFSQTTAKLAGVFEYQITDSARFLQDVTYFAGEEQNTVESNTGLKVKLSDAMNLKASYKLRSNSDLDKDDTTTQITLVYDF